MLEFERAKIVRTDFAEAYIRLPVGHILNPTPHVDFQKRFTFTPNHSPIVCIGKGFWGFWNMEYVYTGFMKERNLPHTTKLWAGEESFIQVLSMNLIKAVRVGKADIFTGRSHK